jgi:hypothetical protein
MMKEIDIDVEVGGLVSNMSYSSTVQFPNIHMKDRNKK